MNPKKLHQPSTLLFFRKKNKGEGQKIVKFGTFGGVFTPTLLTILGVIMYLRLGWVVGNAGLLGAWLIIILSFGITLTTALSMSSITTNIHSAGGAYTIISQALGLEVGGSMGIPRYLSLGLAVTMSIFGFREGWLMIFPTHDPFGIDVIVFVVLFGIAYISTNLAIKTQYVIMAIIFLSFVSIAIAASKGSMHYETREVLLWGGFTDVGKVTDSSFWVVFAVFFPATSGIMAGALMSGNLKEPRKSIPKGTLWAIGVSFVLYMALAYWIARSASEMELLNNYNVIIQKSYFPPLVLAGLLGATSSTALASIIGASRILFAMGQHDVLPKSNWLKKQDATGQPRNALLVTGIIIFMTMSLRHLNAVAPLGTMFLLITYAMMNVVVIIEQRLALISFRPSFTVHKMIPWLGLGGSILAMFIINPTLSLISWAVVLGVYFILSNQHLQAQFEDVRSGLFTSFSEWAAKHTSKVGNKGKADRSWRSNLLVPVTEPTVLKGSYSLIRQIIYPKGSVVLMGIANDEKTVELEKSISKIQESFHKDDLFSTMTIMETEHFIDGIKYGIQALKAAYFRPNIIFLTMLENASSIKEYPKVIDEARALEVGVLLYMPHIKAMLGQRQFINVWVRNSGTWDIKDITTSEYTPNLALLIAYKLRLNWQADIRFITVIKDENNHSKAKRYLHEFMELSRLHIHDIVIHSGSFYEELEKAPHADLNIFGISPESSIEDYQKIASIVDTSCMFVMNSGHENVFA